MTRRYTAARSEGVLGFDSRLAVRRKVRVVGTEAGEVEEDDERARSQQSGVTKRRVAKRRRDEEPKALDY